MTNQIQVGNVLARGTRPDVAEFYHNELHTIDTSYETALKLAQALVAAANGSSLPSMDRREAAELQMLAAIKVWLDCPADRRPSPQALGMRIADIAAATGRAR